MANAPGNTNRMVGLILVVVLVSAAAFSYVLTTNTENRNDSGDGPTSPILDIDDAIHIDGDGEFLNFTIEYSVPGNGTLEYPYVIQNLSIVEDGNCIDIRNVEASFIIRGCELKTTSDYWGIALYLGNCHSAIIENCRAEGGMSGIECFDCSDVVVEDCSVRFSFFGINSSLSQRPIIRGNTVSNNTYGITIIGSNETIIESNRISYNEVGLCSQFSYNCTLTHCNVTNNKLGVHIDVGCRSWVIHSNRFAGNMDGNAKDDGSMNQWDDGIGIGNTWDDYFGIGWYSIPGTANSSDRFPRGT